MVIWLASGNAHKKTELTAILNAGGGECKLLIPADAGLDFDPEETESTFSGNALLKARALYDLLNERRPSLYTAGDPVIADDSGICVDALDGRPGIFSARYAGPQNAAAAPLGVTHVVTHNSVTPNAEKLASSERNALLLAELGDNPQRGARFICAMALMFEPERFFIAQETFEGEIVKGPEFIKGSGGFGYDPIFFVPERGCTAAELSEDEKNTLSHRAKAGKIIAAMLKAFV